MMMMKRTDYSMLKLDRSDRRFTRREVSSLNVKGALKLTEFFNLPIEEKMTMVSDSVHEPMRYGTSLNHKKEKAHFWRLYQALLQSNLELDPFVAFKSPKLQGEDGKLRKGNADEGFQVIAVNCYPACPQPELALGMPPHSDYGLLTILLQSCPGLQVMDHNNNWLSVPLVEGGLVVQEGDQMEVMSNGLYKCVVHRATVNSEKRGFLLQVFTV